MTKKKKTQGEEALYEAILCLKDVEECRRFFQDLCTVNELQAFIQRLEVARLLSQGRIYNDIMEQTGASSATISRVNRSIQYGMGGYDVVLPRMREKQGTDGQL